MSKAPKKINRIPKKNFFLGTSCEWAAERDACQIYVRECTTAGQTASDPIENREAAAACVFEYTREIDLTYRKVEPVSVDIFLNRRPYYNFINILDDAKLTWPLRPWASLSPSVRKQILLRLKDGYSTPPKLDQHCIVMHLAMGTFEKLSTKARRLLDDVLEDETLLEDRRKMAASIPTGNFGASDEHVLFTVDFRESKERLLKGFETWLDSRSDQLQAHAVKLNGKIFLHRLKDLAVLRLWRGKEKVFGVPPFPSSESSASESRTRAVKFRELLFGCTFDDIRELEAAASKAD